MSRQPRRTTTIDYQLKRTQRAVEYLLLAGVNVFFIVSFRSFFEWWMATGLGLSMFFMNLQLTQLREQRRKRSPRDRGRVLADTVESILLLLFIVMLSLGGAFKNLLDIQDQEFLGYVASILAGIFLGGLFGESYWQLRHFSVLETEVRSNYIQNLRRSIIFPFFK